VRPGGREQRSVSAAAHPEGWRSMGVESSGVPSPHRDMYHRQKIKRHGLGRTQVEPVR
jgi:hypothetical protein